MKKFSLIILAVFYFSGCNRDLPETLFEKDGVSFISPEGWKIVDERSTKDSGYHVSCQKKGFRSTGIFMVSWLNGMIELNNYIRLYRNEFEKNVLMKTATIHFEEPVDSIFNGIPCSMSSYYAKILRVESHGEIYSFHCGGRTFMLVFQESANKSVINKMGFEKIKDSFLCKPGKRLSVLFQLMPQPACFNNLSCA